MLRARVIATRTYEKRIAKLLPLEDRRGMGKVGGIGLIYYSWMEPNAVVLITAYAKNQKENLTDADKKEIRKIVESLKRTN